MSTIITRAEVKKQRHRNKLWLIIHDEVYDVTKFIEEHPGGEDTLLDAGGTDASQAFEDVGHSEDARELLKKYKIGTLPDDEKAKQAVPVCCMIAHRMTKKEGSNRQNSSSGKGSCSDCNSVSSALTGKGSKATRFVVPPDKCDQAPTTTANAGKVVVDEENSLLPNVKKKSRKGNWKWLALAAFVIGAIAVGAMVVKKNS